MGDAAGALAVALELLGDCDVMLNSPCANWWAAVPA
jgi:hypothetical protein